MANICTISDGVDTISFYDYTAFGLGDGGHNLGEPGSSPRVLELQTKMFTTAATPLTLTQLEANIGTLRRLLAKAARTTALGMPRLVVLTVQPDTIAVATKYYVLGGSVAPVEPWRQRYLVNHLYEELPITLLVEPWGYGPELQVADDSVTGRTSIDVRFLAINATSTGSEGTPVGVNTAALVAGSLGQTNKFTVTPTIQNLANSTAFYFGCTFGQFFRIVMGVETVKVGGWGGVWEYWTGSTWAGVTTTSEFRSGAQATEFDTFKNLGAIIFTGSMSNWATRSFTVNGVAITAYYVRYRITTASILNMVSNPSFETNTTGYTANVASMVRSSSGVWVVGSWGLIVTTTNVTGSGVFYGDATLLPVVVGLPYSFAAAVALALAGSKAMSLFIVWYTAADAPVFSSVQTFTLNSTTPAFFNMTATAPATADHARLFIQTDGAGGVFDFRTDAWQFKQAAAPTAYADGDQSNAVWTGASHASPTGADLRAPLIINGPARSDVGLGRIGASPLVPGDATARGLVQVINLSATIDIAGVKAAIATGEIHDHPPPFIVDLAGADVHIPSVEVSAVVVADTACNNGERIDLDMLASITDRAQMFDGGGEHITRSTTGSDKLATVGAGSFFIEVLFRLEFALDAGQAPICLASQWNGTAAQSSWWLGIDKGKLRFLVASSGPGRKAANGTTDIPINEWILACGVYNQASQTIEILRDAQVEKTTNGVTNVRNGQTVELRIGSNAGFADSDSLSGNTSEIPFEGRIANVRLCDGLPQHQSSEGYVWPQIGLDIQNDSSDMRWLLRMADNAATTTIVDSAVTFGAALNGTRSANNTNAKTSVGYFQPGAGQTLRTLGMNLPRVWYEGYRGQVKFLLRACPGLDLASIDDVVFQLQLSVGDAVLPMGPPARFGSVIGPGDYYLVDLGTYSLPSIALRDLQPYPTMGFTNAKNVLQADLFVQHQFTVSKMIRLDCLYMLPVSTWYGEYTTFRNVFSTTDSVKQDEGILFDSLGPETVIGQTDASSGILFHPLRNPYADFGGADRVELVPRKLAWLFALPLRSHQGEDYVYHILGDSMAARVHAVGCYDVLANL